RIQRRLLAQRGGEQPRGVQGLQQVVAGGGEEARLRRVRRLRGALRLRGGGQRLAEFGGALVHALLQRLVRLDQRLLGALVRGDGGVGGDVAAAGQSAPAHLDGAAVRAHALEHVRRA